MAEPESAIEWIHGIPWEGVEDSRKSLAHSEYQTITSQMMSLGEVIS
jgi:hypothetical protein